jgi:hypothetical protein
LSLEEIRYLEANPALRKEPAAATAILSVEEDADPKALSEIPTGRALGSE